MTVADLMKQEIECVTEDESVQRAAERMRDAGVGFIPVIDDRQRVVGTLTDRDIAIRLVADNRPATAKVREVMTRELVACRPTDNLEKAEQVMRQRHKSRLLICDKDDRLVGVLSLSDLVDAVDDVSAAQVVRGVAGRELRV